MRATDHNPSDPRIFLLLNPRALAAAVLLAGLSAAPAWSDEDNRAPAPMVRTVGGILTSRGVPDSTINPNQARVRPPQAPTPQAQNFGIVSETDAAVAALQIPQDSTQIDITMYNSIAPVWEGDIGDSSDPSLIPVYQRYISIYDRQGNLLQNIRAFDDYGGPWGRRGGKDCGYHDCQRGYVFNEFKSNGDPLQTGSYPELDTNLTRKISLYNLPALTQITMGTVFVIYRNNNGSPGAVYGNTCGPYFAAQGGAKRPCNDERFSYPVQVGNRSKWKIDYQVSGTPGTVDRSASACPAQRFTFGNQGSNSCVVDAPTTASGQTYSTTYSFDNGNFTYTCDFQASCGADFTRAGSPGAWRVNVSDEKVRNNNPNCAPSNPNCATP